MSKTKTKECRETRQDKTKAKYKWSHDQNQSRVLQHNTQQLQTEVKSLNDILDLLKSSL